METEKKKLSLQTIGIPRLLLLAGAGVMLLVLTFSGDDTGQEVVITPTLASSMQTEETTDENRHEKRLGMLLSSLVGAGDVEVMITENTDGTVQGVLVLAAGASDQTVVYRITEAIEALFDVPVHKIIVLPKENGT